MLMIVLMSFLVWGVILYVVQGSLSGTGELVGIHEVIEVIDPATGADHVVNKLYYQIVYINFTPV